MKNVVLKKIFGYDEVSLAPKSDDSEILDAIRKIFDYSSDKTIKETCLQVLPQDWSLRKMQDELPTSSMYSIRKSKKYSNMDKTGDLDDNKQSAIDSLNASVIDFYCKDEYSRLMPGKKDFKSVKV